MRADGVRLYKQKTEERNDMSVYRCYSKKKEGFDVEAQGLCRQLREQLGIDGLQSVDILNRYDVEQIDCSVYQRARDIVFSEP